MLVLKHGKDTVGTYTRDQLLDMMKNQNEGIGINWTDDCKDSVYLEFKTAQGLPVTITDFTLSYSTFYAKDVLERLDPKDGETVTDADQEKMWMRIYGTSQNICDALEEPYYR